MLTTILTVLPIFAVIATGFACGRLSLLGPTASSELNRFVVYIALPALLFEVMAGANWSQLWQPGFIAAFIVGTFGVFTITLAARVRNGRPLADAAIDGLNAGYANTGFVGFPLCEAVFGRDSLPLATIAAVLTVCVLFAAALVLVEAGLQSEAKPHRVALKVAAGLAKNPLLIAPVAGVAWGATGIPLPAPAQTFLHMMSVSATPCALMALGLFLAVRQDAPGARVTPFVFTALKLIGQPLLTAIVAIGLLGLPHQVAGIVVVMAALPTGTGPFMLAEYYDREAVATSRTILLSTAASVVTLTGLIWLVR